MELSKNRYYISFISIALTFAIPWLFELYTFHLYATNDNTFFAYSGTRISFFVASIVALCYFAGWNIRKEAGNASYYYVTGCAAAAVLSLVMALYQFCETRECYYVGPDGLGEVRLFVLLFSASAVGLIRGGWSWLSSKNKDGHHDATRTVAATTTSPPSSSIHPLFATVAVAIFVGIYPAAWLYDVPSGPTFRVILFTDYVTVPFLLAGLVAAQLGSNSRKWVAAGSVVGQVVLFVLFELLTFADNDGGGRGRAALLSSSWQAVQLIIAICGSASSGIVGNWIGRSYYGHRHHHCRRLAQRPDNRLDGNGSIARMAAPPRKLERTKEKLFASLSVPVFLGFAIFAAHPLLLAPIDLLPHDIEKNINGGNDDYLRVVSSIPSPMYYAGAASNENYHSTKRVEVDLDFASLYQQQHHQGTISSNRTSGNNATNSSNSDVVLAGIGAQSPNCCKDGLDYGYRADVLFTKEGAKYLVARAWETCDQNAACSCFPWRSVMHESIVPINDDSNSVSDSHLAVAMEWAKDGRTVNWYYRISDNQGWTKYSSFTAPAIENPYFNLGVSSINDFIPTNNRFINSLYEDVNFFQVGIATTTSPSDDPSSVFTGGKIVFECPAYYDTNNNGGKKHCFSNMAAVSGSDSYWKVLWGWGGSRPATSIHIDNLKKSVEMTI